MDRRCYRSGTTQACVWIKQLSPQIIDLKHLQLPARNTDTHNSQGSTARLTWREKCFHHLAASQEHLDCPGHTPGWGRLLTHEVPSLMSSSSYTTTSPGIISIFRSIKNCFFFSSSTKAWLVLTRPVLSETAFYIPDVLSTPQSNRRCILCQINKHKSLGKSWVKQPESISSASRFYSFLNGNIQAQFAFPTQQLSFSAIRGEWCITKSDLLD